MAKPKDVEWWLRMPDLVLFGLALTIGGFLGGSKPGLWWSVLVAVLAAAPLSFVTALVAMRRASTYLRAQGVPADAQRLVLRPGVLPRFGGTITTILVTAAIFSFF